MGVRQLMNAQNSTERISGGLDVAAGAIGAGLGITALLTQGAAAGTAAGSAGLIAGTVATPIAVMFAYIKLVHEALGNAYRGLRRANAQRVSVDINLALEAMDSAAASTTKAGAAAILAESDTSEGGTRACLKATNAALADTLTVHSRCMTLVSPASGANHPISDLSAEVAALYSGWEAKRGDLGQAYRAKATPAAAALNGAPEALPKRIDAFSVHGGTIVTSANQLAVATVDWVDASVRR